MTPDDERKALAWMPEEPTSEMIAAMSGPVATDAAMGNGDWRPRVYRALYAYLTKLATKEVWGVSVGLGWVHFDKLEDAMEAATAEARARKRTVTIEPREVPA